MKSMQAGKEEESEVPHFEIEFKGVLFMLWLASQIEP
jgi:hypothetical protein